MSWILAVSDLTFSTQCNRLFPDLYFSVNNKKIVMTCFWCFLFFGVVYPSISVAIIFPSYKI